MPLKNVRKEFFLGADFFNTAALLLPDHDHYQSVIFVYLKKDMVPKIRDALFLFRKKFKRKKCEFFEMSGITEKKRTQILCILFELNYFQGGKFSDNMINSGCIRALIEGKK